jgi:hypothetical protein
MSYVTAAPDMVASTKVVYEPGLSVRSGVS